MTYTKKQFLEDVAKEARALKKNATKEEISLLDAKVLDPDHKARCIYGQMTGNCQSKRAAELIHSCCSRFFHELSVSNISQVTFPMVKKKVNGKKIDGVNSPHDLHDKRSGWVIEFISAIEVYIATPGAQNKNLIDFLKGKRKDLVL